VNSNGWGNNGEIVPSSRIKYNNNGRERQPDTLLLFLTTTLCILFMPAPKKKLRTSCYTVKPKRENFQMVIYKCDGCGKELAENDLRYKVKIDVRAAYHETRIGLADLVRDHREEMLRLIKQMEQQEAAKLEEQVWKEMELDLCPGCQKAYITSPLHFHPEQGAAAASVDIDAFLKSLGFGQSKGD